MISTRRRSLERRSCTPFRTASHDLPPTVGSAQATRRHPKGSPYCCCLPALTRFEVFRRVGPRRQRYLPLAGSGNSTLEGEFNPAVAGCRHARMNARAPLAPHLARPGQWYRRQSILSNGEHTRQEARSTRQEAGKCRVRNVECGMNRVTRSALCIFKAERARFELAVPFGTRALQARALGRTTLPLRADYGADYTRTMTNEQRTRSPRKQRLEQLRRIAIDQLIVDGVTARHLAVQFATAA